MPAPRPTGRLSDLEKGKIIALRDEGMSYDEIAKRVLRPKSTVQSFLERYTARGSAENLSASGKPKLLNRTARRQPVREALKDRQQMLCELRDTVVPEVSIHTVQHALKEEGVQKWKAAKRAFLTDDHAAQRFAWAKKYQHFMHDDWEAVLFSDECSVERAAYGRAQWVFRTPSQRYHKECVQGVTKNKGVKLMVWAFIWGCNKGPLIPIFAKSVNRWVYMEVLKEGLLDAYFSAYDTLGDPLFMQDNAPIHKSGDTMKWLDEHNITVLEWRVVHQVLVFLFISIVQKQCRMYLVYLSILWCCGERGLRS